MKTVHIYIHLPKAAGAEVQQNILKAGRHHSMFVLNILKTVGRGVSSLARGAEGVPVGSLVCGACSILIKP